MFCKNCGKEIDDSAMVCPNCGVATENMAASQAAPAESVENAPKKVNICGIIGFILSLVCVGMTFVHIIAWLLSFAAGLALSITGLVMSKKLGTGKGLSIAGIVITACSIVLYLLVVFVLAALIIGAAGAAGGMTAVCVL